MPPISKVYTTGPPPGKGQAMGKLLLAPLIALALSLPPPLLAHGVRGKVGSGGVVVTAEYDTGEPMSYARVDISAPGAKLPFQCGRTDRNGRFAFFPDTLGVWKVVVDDEVGHRLEINIPVNAALRVGNTTQGAQTPAPYLPKYASILIGICIIIGLFGSILWYKGRGDYLKAKQILEQEEGKAQRPG